MIWPNNLRVENFAFLDLREDPYGQKSTLGDTPFFYPNGSQNRPWGVPTVIWPNNLRVENFAFLDLRGDPYGQKSTLGETPFLTSMGPKIDPGGSYRDLAQ